MYLILPCLTWVNRRKDTPKAVTASGESCLERLLLFKKLHDAKRNTAESSAQRVMPKAVGRSAENAVHFRLCVSLCMVRSVVVHGQ